MDDKLPREGQDRAREPHDEEPDVAAALAFALAPERLDFGGREPSPLPDPFVATPREQEMGRLEDRISELRVEAARAAEERAALADRLNAALDELEAARERIAELEARAGGEAPTPERSRRGGDRARQRAVRALRIALRLLDPASGEADSARR
jgi:hypothetical protein